jgi:hypothetical protein
MQTRKFLARASRTYRATIKPSMPTSPAKPTATAPVGAAAPAFEVEEAPADPADVPVPVDLGLDPPVVVAPPPFTGTVVDSPDPTATVTAVHPAKGFPPLSVAVSVPVYEGKSVL